MEVPKEDQNLVYDIRITSNVPGKITGENKIFELKGIDLAMKLHYIKGLYFFTNTNNNSSTISEEANNNNTTASFISNQEFRHKAAFDWLVSYFMVCGRIRIDESETNGRPTIKMNDAGIRFIEAQSSKTVEEWLAMEGFLSLQDQLIYNHGLGPDLPFSPLVCIQVTWFKCGGISVGLSWAHVLGDAFSASEFINLFGQYMEGHYQQPLTLVPQDPSLPKYHPSNPTNEPISVKKVNPIGTHWVVPTNCKIGTHSFNLTSKQLDQLHLRVHGPKKEGIGCTNQCFEVITSIIWRSIAKVRKDIDTQSVTICRPKTINRKQVVPYNGQVLGTIKANFTVSSVDIKDLVYLVIKDVVDESDVVEELVNNESSKFDFITYGANNITFVDMEEVDLYGFKLKGNYPKFASYTIGGIGDKGVVLVLPGPKDGGNNGSKLIVLLLPEDEIIPLKIELEKEWCIA